MYWHNIIRKLLQRLQQANKVIIITPKKTERATLLILGVSLFGLRYEIFSRTFYKILDLRIDIPFNNAI